VRAVRIFPLVLALGLALLSPAAAQQRAGQAGGCTPDSSWGTPRDDLAARVLELVNAHRRARGLRALEVSPTLSHAAEWKARHMARFAYMSHDDPGPPLARSAAQRIAACGYDGGWGENIAYGFSSAGSVLQGWLGSPGHRANIENGSFSVTGVGAAARGSMVFWAQDFGMRDDSGPTRRPNDSRPSRAQPASPRKLTVSRLVRRLRVRPYAGRRLSARVIAVSRKSGKRIRHGQVKCDARVGRRYLRVVVNAFKGNRAACAWRVPRSAKGRHLSGRIRVRSAQGWGVRWFGRRVR
jgi:uncharacterized protein YkwD